MHAKTDDVRTAALTRELDRLYAKEIDDLYFEHRLQTFLSGVFAGAAFTIFTMWLLY